MGSNINVIEATFIGFFSLMFLWMFIPLFFTSNEKAKKMSTADVSLAFMDDEDLPQISSFDIDDASGPAEPSASTEILGLIRNWIIPFQVVGLPNGKKAVVFKHNDLNCYFEANKDGVIPEDADLLRLPSNWGLYDLTA